MTRERKWLPDQPKPEPGIWEQYSYGKDIRGWHLSCGGMFHADIGRGAKGWLLTLNMHPIKSSEDIEDLKRTAEQHIVARVRQMLPAYKAILGRVKGAIIET